LLFEASQANSLQDPVLKIPITKRAGRVAQGEGPEFKPSTAKKKKKFRVFPLNIICNVKIHLFALSKYLFS
jgi:hypothetical protein